MLFIPLCNTAKINFLGKNIYVHTSFPFYLPMTQHFYVFDPLKSQGLMSSASWLKFLVDSARVSGRYLNVYALTRILSAAQLKY